jgi:membrane-associated phospholipid phosphatase
VLYPPFVLLVIVATGNHFFVDGAAGTLVAAVAATGSAPITRPAGIARLSALPAQRKPLPPPEKLAA